MRKSFLLTFCVLCAFCWPALAQDYTGQLKLKLTDSQYEDIAATSRSLPVPLSCLALETKGGLAYVLQRRDDRVKLIEASSAERQRLQGLLVKFIKLYMPHYLGCPVSDDCQWQLVVDCRPKPGAQVDEEIELIDIPSGDSPTGLKIEREKTVFPLVVGTYYLVNKADDTIVFHDQATGFGSVIDTALDDFAKNLVVRLADYVERSAGNPPIRP